jgi:LSD1 subclass zinc finger protein
MDGPLNWIIHPASAFRDYQRDRRRHAGWDEAYDLKSAGKYAEAAAVYERLAAEILSSNELIYSNDLLDAIRIWILDRNIKKAMDNARSVLKVLNDSGWLKRSESSTEKLTAIIGELQVAGYSDEAETFSNEVNERLTAVGRSLGSIAKRPESSTFPSLCPHCGGKLVWTEGASSIKCPFCDAFIHGEKSSAANSAKTTSAE